MKNFVLSLMLLPCFTFAAELEIDLKPYIDFARQWTNHQNFDQTQPKVKIERHDLVQVFAYGDFESAQAESKGEKLPVVNAVYDAKDRTVYVSNQADLNDSKLKATLVHEMVHYLQDRNGYTQSLNGHMACTESEAYDVQMLWQKFNNVDVDGIPMIYQLSLLAAMKCMGDQGAAFSKVSSQIVERRGFAP